MILHGKGRKQVEIFRLFVNDCMLAMDGLHAELEEV